MQILIDRTGPLRLWYYNYNTPRKLNNSDENVQVCNYLDDDYYSRTHSGAIIEAPNSLEFTPLLAAIRYTNLKCVKALLAANANILTRDGKRQYNALLWAVEVQSQEILMVSKTLMCVCESCMENFVWDKPACVC